MERPSLLTARGLSTSLIPSRGGGFEIDFDFLDHRLTVTVSDGAVRSIPLRSRSIADFYAEIASTPE